MNVGPIGNTKHVDITPTEDAGFDMFEAEYDYGYTLDPKRVRQYEARAARKHCPTARPARIPDVRLKAH